MPYFTSIEFVVDCRKFLDSNSLGLTVAALSSYDPQMRAAAYYVLAAYYSHLEGARFREQSQVSRAEGPGQTSESWLSTGSGRRISGEHIGMLAGDF